MQSKKKILFGILAGLLIGGWTFGENWPRFRGPTGVGLTGDRSLPVHWGGEDQSNILWKSPLVGQGHASPIVWKDRVFVCTAKWAAGVKDRTRVKPDHHVLCYQAESGRLLWDTKIPPGPWLRNDFRSGPGGGYAAPTPVTEGSLVFCAFGSSVLAALDFTGKMVWRIEIVPYSFDVTLGSSPVLHGDTVILLCAMAKKSDSRVVAFDRRTGVIRWERKLPDTGFGHSTPVLIDVKGNRQMLILASGGGVTPNGLQSLNPENGEILWWCRGAGDAASPAHGGGRVYFDSGRGGPGICVGVSGKGDVSSSQVKWTIPTVPEGIGSPIIVGDLVYRLHSPGVLRCWELASGRSLYRERLRGITTTWASPIADPEGKIYFASAGKSFVIRGGRKFEVLATNDLPDANHASPAVSNGRLFLVGMRSIYCIGKNP